MKSPLSKGSVQMPSSGSVVGDDTFVGRKDFTSQPRVTLGIAKMLLAANNLNASACPQQVTEPIHPASSWPRIRPTIYRLLQNPRPDFRTRTCSVKGGYLRFQIGHICSVR
jgi:hypothetical protein